ncbi:glycosyltransferase [Aliivibrio fischeri]|uniref:glycosyltransferase n=1 Tax=Aliivibrio fischeri TaxID=668 RepID=UPI0007C437EC|nr:glycosyltransferase [Aliivibrio fischeri]
MKTIAMLTAKYPFNGGEQFIDVEAKYWSDNLHRCNLIIYPLSSSGDKRNYDDRIKINNCLYQDLTKYEKLLYLIRAFFSGLLYFELFNLIKLNKASFNNLYHVIKVVSKFYSIVDILSKSFKSDGVKTVYCYWNDIPSYAAVYLKRKGIVDEVYTRCHGYDIYEERTKNNYWPLKRFFNNSFNQYFVIANSAKEYLIDKYGVDENLIDVSRLGVENNKVITKPTANKETINILSVSYCVEIKRIDKIIDAIYHFSQMNQNTNITWTHIGDGPLFSQIKTYAEKQFYDSNVSYEFLGNLTNENVLNFYKEHEIDFFINGSENEGVPVSIMEAMVHSIPVIAPDVGGISELLETEACVLLKSTYTVKDMALAINTLRDTCKSSKNREACRDKILSEYNAKINYEQFISIVSKSGELSSN